MNHAGRAKGKDKGREIEGKGRKMEGTGKGREAKGKGKGTMGEPRGKFAIYSKSPSLSKQNIKIIKSAGGANTPQNFKRGSTFSTFSTFSILKKLRRIMSQNLTWRGTEVPFIFQRGNF